MAANKPESYTAEMLSAVIEALQTECARLLAVEEYMKLKNVEKIEIKNSISLKKRGLPMVAAFSQAAVDAMREHQLGGE